MDSLSSAPGNRNSKNKLLSAVFAIAASVSGSVNAATTPNFTEEPAGSEKLVRIMSAQQAILDMLPLNHPSRQSIMRAIEEFKDGGDISELTKIYNWAQTINNSPSAPPAAKEEANKILNTLVSVEENEKEEQQASTLNPKLPSLNETKAEKEVRLAEEKKLKERKDMVDRINKWFFEEKNWSFPGKAQMGDVKDGKDVLEVKFTSKDQNLKRADLTYGVSIIDGIYTIDLEYSGEGVIGYWMYDNAGRSIKVGNQDRFFLNNGTNNLSLPSWVKSIRLFLTTSVSTPSIKVTKFKMNVQ